MLFIKIVNCVIANKPVLISQIDNPDWQVNSKKGNIMRLSLLGQKDSYNLDDSNVAVFEPKGGELYNVKFGDGKYMFKKNKDPGVIGKDITDKSITEEEKEGFLWKITEQDGAYKFQSKGKCLEIRSATDDNNKYVNGQNCKNNNTKQRFKVQEAPIFQKQEEPEPQEEPSPLNNGENESPDVYNLNIFIKKHDHHGKSSHHHKSNHKKRIIFD
ncbi:hypothetical protein TUBRATIS_23610 [Tubulinosema ratisbonensis]|uniref:Ricin B lectin domain-containing protein n=1 Tax=Tubulinosema ratisbonensis TaxID=291195 RepID=A0A437AJA0_9MICR|nr:hypothetical protein TUBRATIS_23610 [Tubulinosema ratisbonensis]